jgi:hypothetical protein
MNYELYFQSSLGTLFNIPDYRAVVNVQYLANLNVGVIVRPFQVNRM